MVTCGERDGKRLRLASDDRHMGSQKGRASSERQWRSTRPVPGSTRASVAVASGASWRIPGSPCPPCPSRPPDLSPARTGDQPETQRKNTYAKGAGGTTFAPNISTAIKRSFGGLIYTELCQIYCVEIFKTKLACSQNFRLGNNLVGTMECPHLTENVRLENAPTVAETDVTKEWQCAGKLLKLNFKKLRLLCRNLATQNWLLWHLFAPALGHFVFLIQRRACLGLAFSVLPDLRLLLDILCEWTLTY